ncbi:Protein kinase domain protein [Candidatus Cyrtobacter comes]|uniref:Protein kinase domain protein n=1 Tax=Candidatus Cyrtobacter comes TaxID=675776 RepID=A0ABU5L6E5_9RICK|nr:hypothetical protein [Candidatus Cyrtobacter comes]MDZ5761699.1 Protein kinase domain protein [Candidatus Cyrtobacter comes]
MPLERIENKNIRVERFVSTDEGYFQVNGNFSIADKISADTYSLLHKGIPTSNYYALSLDTKFCNWFRIECAYNTAHRKLGGIQKVLCAGFVKMSKIENSREFFIVVEKLHAKTLRERFKEKKPLYNEVMKIFTEVFQILKNLHLNKIYHGSINLDNIYITEEGEIKLSEPFSQPCGYSQSYPYETNERVKILKYCKGGSNGYFDFYALGVTAFLLLWKKDEVFIEHIDQINIDNLFSYFLSLSPITGAFYFIIRSALSINHENYEQIIANIENIFQKHEVVFDETPKNRAIAHRHC